MSKIHCAGNPITPGEFSPGLVLGQLQASLSAAGLLSMPVTGAAPAAQPVTSLPSSSVWPMTQPPPIITHAQRPQSAAPLPGASPAGMPGNSGSIPAAKAPTSARKGKILIAAMLHMHMVLRADTGGVVLENCRVPKQSFSVVQRPRPQTLSPRRRLHLPWSSCATPALAWCPKRAPTKQCQSL